MIDKERYLTCSLDHEGVKILIPKRDGGPHITAVWRVPLMPALVSLNFTIGRMMCLNYPLFSLMAGEGYLIVWGLFSSRLSMIRSVEHPLLLLKLPRRLPFCACI